MTFSSTSLLEPEHAEAYQAWKAAPGPETADALLQSLQPVLDSALRSYGGGAAASPTLRSRAKLLTLNAMQRYDPSRAKLRTHLLTQLQGLRRVAAQEGQIIGLPERVGLALHQLKTAENELQERLGREPTTAELADHTGLSVKRIAHVRKAQPGLAEGSLAAAAAEDEESQAVLGPAVRGGTEGEDTWREFVYADLHPTDQLIMEHSLGLHGRPVLDKKAIARKLRVTPGAVSQRAARIQERLDRREELGGAFFGG